MKQTRKCTLSISIFLFVILFFSSAQAQTITWEKKFFSANDGYAMQALGDGGYIAAGGYGPSAIIHTNAQGDSILGKSIGGLLVSSMQTVADGYVLTGTNNSHPYIIKLDQSGTKVWDRYIGGIAQYDNAGGVIATSNALYVTGTFYNNDQTYSLFITKLSLAGDSMWQTTLGKHTTTNGRALTNTNGIGIAKTSDGFIVCGTADSEIYLVKFDQNGNKVWDHSYPGIHSTSDVDIAYSVAVTADGGYILCGSKALSNASFNTVIILLKTTSDGTQTWRQSVGGSSGVGRQILVESDGYVLTGVSSGNGHIIKTDLLGTTVWDKQLSADYTYGLDKGKDGSYTAVGSWVDGAMYLGNVKAGTAPPPPDKQTYIYTYNGQGVYKFHTDAPNGWAGAGAGKISTPGSGVIAVNDGVDFYATDFTIDTTRTSATSPISFHGNGSMLINHSPLSSKATTFGSGAFSGKVSGSNITFDSPLTCDSSLAGLSISLNSVNPGPYPSAASVSASGSLRGLGFWSCRTTNGDINFSRIVFNPATIDLQTIEDIEVAPGSCIKQITSSYGVQSNQLSLNGTFYSPVLLPGGVAAGTFVDGGKLGLIILNDPTMGIPIGANTPYHIDSLLGLLSYDYSFFPPIGPKALIKGTLKENAGQTELYQADLTTALFTMPGDLKQPGVLGQADVNFRSFKTGDKFQITGFEGIQVTWSPDIGKTKFFGGHPSHHLHGGLLPGATSYIFNGDIDPFLFEGITYSHSGAQQSLYGKASGKATMPVLDLSQVSSLGPIAAVALALYPAGTSFDAYLHISDYTWYLALQKSVEMFANNKNPAFELSLDFSKNPTDPGFLSMRPLKPLELLGEKVFAAHQKHNQPTSAKMDTLKIGSNVAGAYIRLKGINDLPTATIVDPNGKQIMQSLADSSVITVGINSHESWWVLDHPIAGTWLMSVNGNSGDSIISYIIRSPDAFNVEATQTNRTVHVTWTNSLAANGNVTIFLTKDTVGSEQQVVASAKQSDGSVIFELTDNMPECSYRLFAVREFDGGIQTAYAPTALSNPKSILASPTGIAATYSKKDTGVVVTWNKATDPNIIGYAIRLTGNGMDSTVATPYGFQTQSAFRLKSPDGMFISILSYDSLGRRGCWSDPIALGAAGVESPRTFTAPDIAVAVMPNPSTGRTSLQITLVNQSSVAISIYDEAGREVTSLPETTFGSGTFKINLGTEFLSSGSYTALVRAGNNIRTIRFVIEK